METSYIHKKQDVFTHALTYFVISAVNLNELLVSMWIELVICIFSLLWILHIQKRRKLPLGPVSGPLFGTLELFTTKKKFLEFITDEKHNKCYKDFCSFYLGPFLVLIVINNYKYAKELFNKDEFSGTYVILVSKILIKKSAKYG